MNLLAGLLARALGSPWWVCAAAVLALGSCAGIERNGRRAAETTLANERAAWTQRQADASLAAAQELGRRQAVMMKEAQDAREALSMARRDADAAGAAAAGLRDRVVGLLAADRASRAGAAGGGPAAADAADLLADVLGRADARAGELARIADERGAAGAACERAFDAMTRP